jgi:hypothetical protein
LNVKSASPTLSQFNFPYGVSFDTSEDKKGSFIFFADQNLVNDSWGNGIYDSADASGSVTRLIKNNSFVSALCVGTSETNCASTPVSVLDITFRRPDPNAVIVANSSTHPYAEIILESNGGSKRKVVVRSTGHISVPNN